MPLYRFNYLDTKSGRSGQGEESASSEIMLKQIINPDNRYEITNIKIIENTKNLSFLDKIKNYLEDNISFNKGISKDLSLQIINAYATAKEDNMSNKEAFTYMQEQFGRNDKKAIKIIQKLYNDSLGVGITCEADVFEKNKEFFPEDFIKLMEETKNAEIDVNKLLSNPVPYHMVGKEIEGYVQLKTSSNELEKEIYSALRGPIQNFVFYFLAIVGISTILMPKVLGSIGEKFDLSQESYYGFGEFALGLSNFFVSYGLYFLVFLILALSVFIFLLKTSKSFVFNVHKMIFNMPLFGDIVMLNETKKVASLLGIFHKSGMSDKRGFDIVINNITYLPLKEELIYIRDNLVKGYEYIFDSYEDKYLTNVFYSSLRAESSSHNSLSGRYDKAFARTLKNCVDRWNISVKKYPKIIGLTIDILGKAVVYSKVLGLFLVIIVATSAGANM